MLKGYKNTIELRKIKKAFKKSIVISDISILFEANKIYGIVGENGSGKSVLLKIICGLIRPTEGVVLYNDRILKKDMDFLPSLGLIIEKPGFFNELTAFENLYVLSKINNTINKQTIIDVIKRVGLENDDKKVGNYSLGMRQRLGLAQAIMESPDILILDEFSTGLDTDGVDLAHDILRTYKGENKIIIITSHSSYDIKNLCDKVYRISRGVLHEEHI